MPPGALFLGCLLAGGEQTIRVSSGSCVRLPPLRSRERLNLARRGLQDADLAALLGALSLNQCLKELDLGGNTAPSGSHVKAAMVQALPWQLLRAYRELQTNEMLASLTHGMATDANNPPAGLE